jgi:trehalose 6-phosphate phosphatase
LSDLLQAVDELLKHDELLIGMDRDGTLVPYANRPEEAVVTDALRRLVADLCARHGLVVAVLSARSAAQLRGDFDNASIVMAGNYGMEVVLPDGTECIQPYALSAVPMIKEVRDDLSELLDLENGLILEDHGYSLCLHWQNVPISRRDEVHRAISTTSDRFRDLKFRRLPTSYEVLPNIPWDKGFGMSFVDASTTRGVTTDAKRGLLFAGDTESDSPAFDYVNEHGGVSIRIGGDGDRLRAQHWLSDPSELHELLEYITQRRQPRINRASA